jgi:hypothetical protein
VRIRQAVTGSIGLIALLAGALVAPQAAVADVSSGTRSPRRIESGAWLGTFTVASDVQTEAGTASGEQGGDLSIDVRGDRVTGEFVLSGATAAELAEGTTLTDAPSSSGTVDGTASAPHLTTARATVAGTEITDPELLAGFDLQILHASCSTVSGTVAADAAAQEAAAEVPGGQLNVGGSFVLLRSADLSDAATADVLTELRALDARLAAAAAELRTGTFRANPDLAEALRRVDELMNAPTGGPCGGRTAPVARLLGPRVAELARALIVSTPASVPPEEIRRIVRLGVRAGVLGPDAPDRRTATDLGNLIGHRLNVEIGRVGNDRFDLTQLAETARMLGLTEIEEFARSRRAPTV